MKTNTYVFILLCLSQIFAYNAFGQKVVVPFKNKNGVFEVDAKIYELSRKFIFDTGASSISFGEDFYNELITRGHINKANILGTTQCIIANGTCVDALVINLDYVALGEFEMQDVQATVIRTTNVPFLLGQSLLSKFGQITLDYNNSQLLIDQNNVSKYQNEYNELRFIPCNLSRVNDCDNLMRYMANNHKWTFKIVSKETNVPPPTNALKNINNPVTVRYFDNDDFNTAIKLKDELFKKGYSVIKIQNMIPYFGYKAIPGYFEIWIK